MLQSSIAARVVTWLKTEHPIKEQLLPTDAVGEALAEAIVSNVQIYLQKFAHQPMHELRLDFDNRLNEWILKLKHDPDMLQKGEDLKHNEDFNAYVQGLRSSLSVWLENDLRADHSLLQRQVSRTVQWLAQSQLSQHELRQALNSNIEHFVSSVGPGVVEHLTAHTSTTIKQWGCGRDIGRD